MLSEKVLMKLYHRLYDAYGPQHWWPGDTPFEIMVGAVLTQNTNWKNVEKAITNLKQAGVLELSAIKTMEAAQLAEHIRPSGYFNVKSVRLKNLCNWLHEQGDVTSLEGIPTDTLRKGLLSVNGIGPETADDILLYAFDRPVFVIDTYTRRLLKTLDLIDGKESYEELRALFERHLSADSRLYNEYHALIVRHAKEKCSKQGDCLHCGVINP